MPRCLTLSLARSSALQPVRGRGRGQGRGQGGLPRGKLFRMEVVWLNDCMFISQGRGTVETNLPLPRSAAHSDGEFLSAEEICWSS